MADETGLLSSDTTYETLMDERTSGDVAKRDDDDEEIAEVNVIPAAAADATEKESGKSRARNRDVVFGFLAFTSFSLLVQASWDCESGKNEFLNNFKQCRDKLAFAVSASVISFMFVVAYFVVEKAPGVKERVPFWNKYIQPFLVLALWILWCVTAIALTFPNHKYDGFSYVNVSTGWLMIWMSVSATTMALYPSFRPAWSSWEAKQPFLKNVGAPDGQSTILLIAVLLCSITVMWSGADVCDAQNENKRLQDCRKMYAWSVVCPMGSLLYALVFLMFGKSILLKKKVYQILSVRDVHSRDALTQMVT